MQNRVFSIKDANGNSVSSTKENASELIIRVDKNVHELLSKAMLLSDVSLAPVLSKNQNSDEYTKTYEYFRDYVLSKIAAIPDEAW